jgi:TonB-linked SusC/RagA family outer membrane protein
MNKFRFFIASILLLIPAVMFSQMKVSGTVTEAATGQPLPGVNIQIVGTTQGTTSDFDGNYQLENVKTGSVLEFSYIGFVTEQVKVATGTINMAMKEDAESLDEVVVIGYGTAKKSDLTGSVNMVSAKDFNQGSVTTAQNLITGKIAGVNVTAPSGAPGEGTAIRIRGISSISLSNDPLYVVDGLPLDSNGVGGSRNILDLINPNDIESMVVLKDASATAIYGSRAANGVIMITTKKGKDKDFTFNYGTKASFYHAYNTVDMMTAAEFRSVVNQIGSTAAKARLGSANTDWQKEIFNDAVGYDHDFSGVGSLLKVPVRFSLGYSNQDGILKTDNFSRTTASLSLTPSLLDEHLKFEINARGTEINNFFANTGAIGNAIRFDPTQSVYDVNSPFGGYFTWLNTAGDAQLNLAPTNPVALLELRKNTAFVERLIGNVKMDYKLHFFPDVVGTINVGMDKSKSKGRTVQSALMPTSDADWNGSLERYTNERSNKLLDAYFTYSKVLNDHDIKLAAGYSYQSLDSDNYNYDSEKMEDGNTYEFYDLEKEVMLSYFGRLNYAYKDKINLTATLRADASSKLNPNDRWGYFPSAALAWNIHNENFMANSKINELKLRIGYGEVGNVSDLDPYLFLTNYVGSESTAEYQFGNEFYQTYRPSPINTEIRWEIGRTLNFGLDFAAFNRRLSGAINVYNKETIDMIIPALIDPFTNFGNEIETNIGNMVNKGIELELSGILIQKEDLDWKLSYNISYNDNEITKMEFDQPWGGIDGGVGNNVQIMTEGQSPASFFVYQQVYDNTGKPIEGVYVDRNDDDVINNEDKYYYKDPYADILMGLNTSLKIKNFDLSVSARANVGNYMYDNIASSKAIPYDINAQAYLSNLHTDYFETGFQTFTETNFLSDHYVSDASFIKIDNVTFGMSFPEFLKKSDLRVFGSVQNVATFTKYTGLDPEIYGGIDNNFYPRPRTFTFGFNINF